MPTTPNALPPEAQSEASLYLGHTIKEYRLESLIASGGMGLLFRAESVKPNILPRYRAIKLLPQQVRHDEQIAARFTREGRIVHQLDHPNVVELKYLGQHEKFGPYMVMEYLDGQTLKQLSKERINPFPTKKLLEWLQQICQALNYCHRQQIVHRDIKPANIYIHAPGSKEEQVKLIDFGIAASPREPDNPGERVGTPRYMAPEQILKQPVSNKTDIYSLGVVLFELLTRRVMFQKTESEDLRQAHLHNTPPTLADTRPDLVYAPALEDLLQQTLSKDPQPRPESAAALFQRLSQILTEQPIEKKKGPLGIVVQQPENAAVYEADAPTPPPTQIPTHRDTPPDPIPSPTQQDNQQHTPTPQDIDALLSHNDDARLSHDNEWENDNTPPSTTMITLVLFGGVAILGAVLWIFFFR